MNEPKTALVVLDIAPLRNALMQSLAAAGYTVREVAPEALLDEDSWVRQIGGIGTSFSLLVYGVEPPRMRLDEMDFASFGKIFSSLAGGFWLGGTLCGRALRANGGGAMIALIPPKAADLPAMFADGLRALASCFGAGFGRADNPVRVLSLAVDHSLPQRTAALAAFFAVNGTYVTATSMS